MASAAQSGQFPLNVPRNNKRRSQSCIDGQNLRGRRKRQSSSGERPAYDIMDIMMNDSHGGRWPLEGANKPKMKDQAQGKRTVPKDMMKPPQKPIPHTTKNFVEEMGEKPRSFVDEIK